MKDLHKHARLLVCQPDADHHCPTCSDEAVPVRVLRIDPASGIAFVEVSNQVEEGGSHSEEVDITLVEDVVPGDLLLVHGGVAIARQEEGESDVK